MTEVRQKDVNYCVNFQSEMMTVGLIITETDGLDNGDDVGIFSVQRDAISWVLQNVPTRRSANQSRFTHITGRENFILSGQ